MRARRLRAGLKGWGGVGAMAAVCALALTLLLFLLPPRTQPYATGAPAPDNQRTAQATRTRADTCKDDQAHNQSLSPSNADGPTLGAIRSRGYLSVGVDQNSYRWGYRNPNNSTGELEGFDIDLAHRIAKDILGDENKVQFKAIPTNERIPAIRSGRVDMVVRTMTITCDRLKQVAFSAPYFLTGQQVLAPKTSRITGYDASLAGRRVCSATGSTAYDHLSAGKKDGRLPASTDITTTVPNQLDCLVRLQLGEVDAVVTDSALAASQAAQDPAVALKGTSFTKEFYGVAMKLDADDLVRRVNRILEDYRKDGGWKASYDTWLSATLGRESSSATPPTASYR
ncbi:sugar-binding protein [Streptomyces sp. NTH33]|uniref:glutamate ABC transporter substrate-binding protein n=1 Tax=Streptomyces sp. NTH33 TaxID=1735453 RepID=UPI000DA8C343|nr:glutamate ABC transporter substrate-binding protein [Streptomyces sp. NTH33]PZG83464.1 sugar-binding protein [Streptomyces sp. NTH33]